MGIHKRVDVVVPQEPPTLPAATHRCGGEYDSPCRRNEPLSSSRCPRPSNAEIEPPRREFLQTSGWMASPSMRASETTSGEGLVRSSDDTRDPSSASRSGCANLLLGRHQSAWMPEDVRSRPVRDRHDHAIVPAPQAQPHSALERRCYLTSASHQRADETSGSVWTTARSGADWDERVVLVGDPIGAASPLSGWQSSSPRRGARQGLRQSGSVSPCPRSPHLSPACQGP